MNLKADTRDIMDIQQVLQTLSSSDDKHYKNGERSATDPELSVLE